MTVTATAAPTSGNAPLSTVLTAAVTGGQGPYTYAWNFGDGQTGTGNVTSHTYTAAGTYTATVTVTDNTAATKTASVTINVSGPVVENPVITSVTKVSNPFRLRIYGSKFKPGCIVKINNVAVPTTTYKDSTLVVAKKGAALKAMCPKGTAVTITVHNTDGGVSAGFTYTR
ncbi:MAG: PKD domain-containing protein [Acidobacteria bacterium]|nr:PKD domain-containing protein [Acidobacteriota bacterium]